MIQQRLSKNVKRKENNCVGRENSPYANLGKAFQGLFRRLLLAVSSCIFSLGPGQTLVVLSNKLLGMAFLGWQADCA